MRLLAQMLCAWDKITGTKAWTKVTEQQKTFKDNRKNQKNKSREENRKKKQKGETKAHEDCFVFFFYFLPFFLNNVFLKLKSRF